MLKQLKDEDRRAVDLLMDRNPAAMQESGKPVFALASQGAFHDRLAGVEKILHLLDEMPAADPSDSLLDQTLKMVDEAAMSDAIGQGAVREAPRPIVSAAGDQHLA